MGDLAPNPNPRTEEIWHAPRCFEGKSDGSSTERRIGGLVRGGEVCHDSITEAHTLAAKVGVGYSENTKSYEAGAEAARAALVDGDFTGCNLVLLFATEKHNPERLRDGICSVVGSSTKLIGGYSMGIITKNRLGYDGYQVGVALLASDSVTIDMFIEGGLVGNEYKVGLALGEQINRRHYDGTPNVLLMYDSVVRSVAQGLALNMATPLIEGISGALGSWPPMAGVGMMGSMQWNPTFQWFNDRVEQHSAMALVLSGGVRMDTIIMHGCRPASGYHTITKAEGSLVLEIDGKPALDAVADLLGPDSEKSWEDYPLFVTLGVNKGDKFGPFKEEDYANRMVMAVDQQRRALVMFENDLKPGFEVQLMRRSIDFDYIGRRADELLNRVGDRTSFFALYIDCAGRASAYCGTEREEAEEVQRVIGSRMPLLGMYSGVEIAKVGPDMQALDWTGVLCVFSE